MVVTAADHRLSGLGVWDLPHTPPYRLGRVASLGLPPCVPPSLITMRSWYWNIDQLSIAYASPPRLRPDSPAADQHGCGTLGHSVGRIRTARALLIPAFALGGAPAVLPLDLHSSRQRSPTIASEEAIRSVGGGLKPRYIVGASARSTSELLRTLSRMAASKPTSWLSLRTNSLAH